MLHAQDDPALVFDLVDCGRLIIPAGNVAGSTTESVLNLIAHYFDFVKMFPQSWEM